MSLRWPSPTYAQSVAKHLLAFFVIAFAQAAISAEHFLFVSHATEATPLDRSEKFENSNFIAEFHEIFEDVLKGTRVLHVTIDRLEDLSAELAKTLQPDDIIRGVAFLGHGSTRDYQLSRGQSYSGTEVAKSLLPTVAPFSDKSSLLVYFGACLCGMESSNGRSFQDEFTQTMRESAIRENLWSEVKVVAHRQFTYLKAGTIQKVSPVLRQLFFQTRVPEIMYRMDLRFGENAKMILPTLGIAFVTLAMGQHDAYSLINNIGISMVPGVAISVALEALSYQSRSWVKLIETGFSAKIEDTKLTLNAAIRRALARTSALDCREVFSGS